MCQPTWPQIHCVRAQFNVINGSELKFGQVWCFRIAYSIQTKHWTRSWTSGTLNFGQATECIHFSLTIASRPLDPGSNCFHLWVLTNNTHYAQAVTCINWISAQVWPSRFPDRSPCHAFAWKLDTWPQILGRWSTYYVSKLTKDLGSSWALVRPNFLKRNFFRFFFLFCFPFSKFFLVISILITFGTDTINHYFLYFF